VYTWMELTLAKQKNANTALEYDLVIIGAGITGAGTARDAARRGLSVLVVDQGDVAAGTSSCSSKLVHGGLRYLEQGELALVFESVAERRILLNIAPHLVLPLPFLLPVFDDSPRGMLTINIGMWLYDGLSLFRSPKLHKSLSRRKVRSTEPQLRAEGLKGAQLYYDCSTDDARLTLETLLDAQQAGAEISTYSRVEGFQFEAGRITGLELRDQLNGHCQTVSAKVVVNATGPWSDMTRSLAGTISHERMRPTKGVHIVLNADKLRLEHAVCCMHPDDGRVFFSIPWGEQTYIGTTDTDTQGDPGSVFADAGDVAYLLRAVNAYFPGNEVSTDDVISTWAGVRPLVGDESADDESSVSREHVLAVEPHGMVTIAGGKLTTFRRMAAEVVDTVVDQLKTVGASRGRLRAAETAVNPLPGAVGWPEQGGIQAVSEQIMDLAAGLISAQTAMLLAQTYGMRGINIAEAVVADPASGQALSEGRHEILAQVDWGVNHELVRTVSDIMIRRTQLFYRAADQGLSALKLVSERLAILLELKPEASEKQVEFYRAQVQRSQAWRAE